MGTERLILQLGSDSWQRRGIFATGAGIVHQQQHAALDRLPGVSSYSIWPSPTQRAWRPDVRVIPTERAVPVYLDADTQTEAMSANVAAAPTHEAMSAKQDSTVTGRWHDVLSNEFRSFRRLVSYATHEWAYHAEMAEGVEVSLMIAHHAFLNPLILGDVQRRREREGRPLVPVLCFAHGPELEMLAREASGFEATRYPSRFVPMLTEAGMFDPKRIGSHAVDICATATSKHAETFLQLFPEFPSDRVVVSRPGYDQSVFVPKDGRHEGRDAVLAAIQSLPRVDGSSGGEAVMRPNGLDAVVVCVGELSDRNRTDALLRAARHYEAGEPTVATIIAGAGTDDQRRRLETLAYDNLGLRDVFFLGPQRQTELAKLFDVADIGVFPSRRDSYGLAMLECMGCATPVVGVDTGDHKMLVNEAVGRLVPETDVDDDLSISLAIAVADAVNEGWKVSRGLVAREFVTENFNPVNQMAHLVDICGDVFVR